MYEFCFVSLFFIFFFFSLSLFIHFCFYQHSILSGQLAEDRGESGDDDDDASALKDSHERKIFDAGLMRLYPTLPASLCKMWVDALVTKHPGVSVTTPPTGFFFVFFVEPRFLFLPLIDSLVCQIFGCLSLSTCRWARKHVTLPRRLLSRRLLPRWCTTSCKFAPS